MSIRPIPDPGHDVYSEYIAAAKREAQEYFDTRLKAFKQELDREVGRRRPTVAEPFGTADRTARRAGPSRPFHISLLLASHILALAVGLAGGYFWLGAGPGSDVRPETEQQPTRRPPATPAAVTDSPNLSDAAAEMTDAAARLPSRLMRSDLVLDSKNPILLAYRQNPSPGGAEEERLIALVTQVMLNGWLQTATRVQEDGMLRWSDGKPAGETGRALMAFLSDRYLPVDKKVTGTDPIGAITAALRKPPEQALQVLHHAAVADYLERVR